MVATGIDELVPAGYIACRCGEFIVATKMNERVRLCPACLAADGADVQAQMVSYDVDGMTFTIEDRKKPKPKQKSHRKPGTPLTENEKAGRRAKMRATNKLLRIYRPQFELLLAQERALEGLDPKMPSYNPGGMLREALKRDIVEAGERERRAGEARLLRGA